MPWFHVNGIPVLARSKEDAVALWKAGKLVPLHPRDQIIAVAVGPQKEF